MSGSFCHKPEQYCQQHEGGDYYHVVTNLV
jgi:hypothetical protein